MSRTELRTSDSRQAAAQAGYRIFPCDLCGSDDAVEIPEARLYTGGQPIHVCRSCGFVYVRARRSVNDIATTWSNELFQKTYTARQPYAVARQTFVMEFTANAVGLNNRRIIDIGAGEGQFFELLRRFGYTPAAFLGIEPAAQNCQRMTSIGCPSFLGTIESYLALPPGQRQRFDLATIMWTLENTQDCRGMLKGAHDLLDDDGHVVVATGSRILVPFKKPLQNYLSAVPADTCNFRVSARTLKGLLAVSGFAVEHSNHWVDSDFLVMIARKAKPRERPAWEPDDYEEVLDFFRRWHAETAAHYPES